ncbi:hypothetical protein ACFX2A_038100 [Malus domestica]
MTPLSFDLTRAISYEVTPIVIRDGRISSVDLGLGIVGGDELEISEAPSAVDFRHGYEGFEALCAQTS